MDHAKLALEYLVAGNASDSLLAHATRELLGRGRSSRESRPLPGQFPLKAEPLQEPGAPLETSPASAEYREESIRVNDGPPRPVRARTSTAIEGSKVELVRINVHVDGRRTSLSMPAVEWRVLERRFGGRLAILEAAETAAQAFRGRGSRSAWVLDQLEAQTLREGDASAQSAEGDQRPLPLAPEAT